ncbi:MAG: transaldolase [Selenomonadaceae bacterium]|nr:transaldolase [Selenomonadaceae bacterium]
MKIEDLKVDIYADGADIDGMLEMSNKSYIKGFTTNPSLMKKAGVKDYAKFAKEVTSHITDLPISFEVFADDFPTMKKEALILSKFGKNVFVKIPVTNTKGESSANLVKELSAEGVNLNITAIFTLEQTEKIVDALSGNTKNIISVFAGRIADTGVDPEPLMKKAAKICHEKQGTKLLWASCREVFNVVQADRSDTDIITVTNDILGKLKMFEKDLTEYSLDTVKQFYEDGKSLGFHIA